MKSNLHLSSFIFLDILARPIRPLPPKLRPQHHHLRPGATARRRLRRRPAIEVGRVTSVTSPGLLLFLGRGLDDLAQLLEAVGQLDGRRELPDGGHLLRVRVRVGVGVGVRVRVGV